MSGLRKHTSRGQLRGVFEDNRRNRIHWYQASGAYRELEGAQVFIDPQRRTTAVTQGEKVIGTAEGRCGRTGTPRPARDDKARKAK